MTTWRPQPKTVEVTQAELDVVLDALWRASEDLIGEGNGTGAMGMGNIGLTGERARAMRDLRSVLQTRWKEKR